MAYRYYLTQRPPVPGAVPESGRIRAVEDFGGRKYVQKIGEAYGYVEYDQPLTQIQIHSYELTEETFPYELRFEDGSKGLVYTTEDVARKIRVMKTVKEIEKCE